eukprot:353762-Chlamydomonas_euryale.AAC.3
MTARASTHCGCLCYGTRGVDNRGDPGWGRTTGEILMMNTVWSSSTAKKGVSVSTKRNTYPPSHLLTLSDPQLWPVPYRTGAADS